jgi:hypothetical protein
MSGEIHSSMQCVQLPKVILQQVETIYPALLRVGVVSALCRLSHFIVLFPVFIWPKKSKYSLGIL